MKGTPLRKVVLTPTTARIVALIAVIALLLDREPFFLTSSNLLNIMQNTVVVGIVAAPLTLLLVARQVDLSVGSAVALAATTLAVVVETGYGIGGRRSSRRWLPRCWWPSSTRSRSRSSG